MPAQKCPFDLGRCFHGAAICFSQNNGVTCPIVILRAAVKNAGSTAGNSK